MSRPSQPSTPESRDRAQARVRTLTRAAVFAATGIAAFMGIVVAREHPGSSSPPKTTAGTGSGTATTTPSTSSGSSGTHDHDHVALEYLVGLVSSSSDSTSSGSSASSTPRPRAPRRRPR